MNLLASNLLQLEAEADLRLVVTHGNVLFLSFWHSNDFWGQ